MDPVNNPFRPGAGRRPPLLAGRQSLLAAFDVVRRRAEEFGEGERGWVLYGLRGVGKTVLLNELMDQVNARGWITAKVEAGAASSLQLALSQALVKGLRTATGKHPKRKLSRLLGVFRAFSIQIDPDGAVGIGVDVAPIRGVADTGRFAEDLPALADVLGETARDLGVGVLILIDELQEATAEELLAVNATVHGLGQASAPLPVVFVGAGLPSLPALLADASSYAERLYDFHAVGLLDRAASLQALTVPTEERGVRWTRAALARAVETAGGYPYFLQSIGKHVWDNAVGSPISGDDVSAGLAFATREVDEGLYQSRWARATPAQRIVLRAVADVGKGDPAPVAEVARAMGKRRPSDISVARDELIKRGLLYAPERGFVAFTVPGMDSFIARQS